MCGCPEFVPRYHPGALLCICGHAEHEMVPVKFDFGLVPIGRCTRVADTA